MRRYSPVRNAIERNRERWGLGDVALPTGREADAYHPLPTTPGEKPFPYGRPLPGIPDRPLWNEPQWGNSGAVNYAARQRLQLDEVPKGSPDKPIVVYPAWESRLVDMRDFLAVLPFTAFEEGVFTGPGVMLLDPYIVPQGYTAFLKEFRFFMVPLPAPLTEANTLITLTVDGNPVPDYFNLPLGALMTVPQKTFVIATEGRRLGMRIAISEAVIIPASTAIRALYYGNLRVRTGNGPALDAGVSPPPLPLPPPAPVQFTPSGPPASAKPEIPPWPISWRAVRTSTGPAVVPMQNDRGQRRDLTAAEIQRYGAYLKPIWPGRDGRPL